MKVKIISFVIMLVMVASLLSGTVTASSTSGIMCSNYYNHSQILHALYYCTGCSSETHVCNICYPDHTHTSSAKCQTHGLYYSYCKTCYGYHCPNSSHGHSTSNYYCKTHKNVAYSHCSYCETYYCSSCYGGYHTHSPSGNYYCKTHKNVAYSHCSYCETYYCSSCYGGYHTHSSYGNYYCNTHKNVIYSYCSPCDSYYCSSCYGGYHSHSSGSYNSSFYCGNHSTYVLSSYCAICGVYYCASCYGAYHSHSNIYGDLRESYFICKKHTIEVGATQCGFCDYYYCPTCYGGYHSHGAYKHAVYTCDSPRANISNNSSVAYNTKITLVSDTPNTTIYYTTNGTVPTVNSNRYNGEIKLTKNTTIKAIAVRAGYNNSSVSSFRYTVKSKVSYNDISNYPGLSSSLSIIIDAGVYSDGTSFKPSNPFTFGELETWLDAIDVSFDGVTGIDNFDVEDELTYNDFIYILYKALRKADLIKTPKSAGYDTLKSFTYNKDITNTSLYKAAFVSSYENNLLYDINFKPNDPAMRVYLATAIAAVIENNDL